jgi:CHAD domain-containing protein
LNNKHVSCPRGHDQAQAAIQTLANVIAEQAQGVSALDGTAIHDMRVASRRLRMALDIYHPYLPSKPRKNLRKLVRSITRDLGTRRELDVMAIMMREHREETHGVWQRFMDHAINIIDARRDHQAEYCRDAATLAASERFQEAVIAVFDAIETEGICVLELAQAGILGALSEARAARKEWRRTDDPEALHLVRIALKHLRYACEFHAPLYGEPMAAQINHIKAAQEILGEWNECRLLEDMVLTLGGAADYSLAQGAPLVAEAYGKHAEELAEQFGPIGKALLGKQARKELEAMISHPDASCCKDKIALESTIGADAPCES